MFSVIIWFFTLILLADVTYSNSPQLNDTIMIQKMVSTWDKANHLCKQKGGLLASPINGEVLSTMTSLMNTGKMYHIGIRAGYSSWTYISVEGVPLENMTEANNLVQELDALDGDCMAMDSQRIFLVPCWTRLQSICYKPIKHKTTCDRGYKYDASTENCYKLHTDPSSWNEAQDACVAEDGHLAVIANANEAQSIKNMFEIVSNNTLHIGLRQRTGNGDWYSVNGQPVSELYNVWHWGNTPSDTDRQCGVMYYTGVLADWYCSWTYAFVCQKKPVA